MSGDAVAKPWYARWWAILLVISAVFYMLGSNPDMAPVFSMVFIAYMVYLIYLWGQRAAAAKESVRARKVVKSVVSGGSVAQLRGVMLELGFWKYVFRVGVLLLGLMFTLVTCVLGMMYGFQSWIGIGAVVFSNVINGFFFSVLSWPIVKWLSRKAAPAKGGSTYEFLLRSTSGSGIVGMLLAFVVVIALFSSVPRADFGSAEVGSLNHSITVNIIEPELVHDCSSLDVASASEQTVFDCNTFNWCDKVAAYDITVRKSATEAIADHLDQPYSVYQLLDIYDWAKENIAYQNVPLDDYAPYRPSETITLKSGDCKNYGAVIASMVLSIGGYARVVAIPGCRHAFAEVLIGGETEVGYLKEAMQRRYRKDMELTIIKDSYGFYNRSQDYYWLILDGAGAAYPGTSEIKGCLDSAAERFYSYSCVSPEGRISKQTYKKEYVSSEFSWNCGTCVSVNDCGPECRVLCIKAEWTGVKDSSGYVIGTYAGRNYVSCTCSCYA